LSNGNYVVRSPAWSGNRGAVTWANGSTGVRGTISEANSLVGSNPDDRVGFGVAPLSNGDYIVHSPNRSGNRGAATWGDGSTGIRGTISEANSLVGSNANDFVGGYGVRWCGRSSLRRAVVQVAGFVGPVGHDLRLEQPGTQWSQQAAL
jgi:hypothetical protein